MRELEPQHHQGGDDPVGERQLTIRARALSAQPVPATAPLPQPRFLLAGPRAGQLSDQLAQAATWQAGADTMRQGRAGPSRRHILIVPRGRSRSRERHAKISRYAWDLLSRTKSLGEPADDDAIFTEVATVCRAHPPQPAESRACRAGGAVRSDGRDPDRRPGLQDRRPVPPGRPPLSGQQIAALRSLTHMDAGIWDPREGGPTPPGQTADTRSDRPTSRAPSGSAIKPVATTLTITGGPAAPFCRIPAAPV